jgi:hypothetical protein
MMERIDLTKYTNKGLSDLLFNSVKEENYELTELVKEALEARKDSHEYTMTMAEQTNTIINNFDFDKVAHAMEALNWTWLGTGTPTVEELRASAQDKLISVWNAKEGHEYYSISSGGLLAERFIYDGVKCYH